MNNIQDECITSIYMGPNEIRFNDIEDFNSWPDIKCTRRAIGIAQFLDSLGLEGVQFTKLNSSKDGESVIDISIDPKTHEGKLVNSYLDLAKKGEMPPLLEDVLALIKSGE